MVGGEGTKSETTLINYFVEIIRLYDIIYRQIKIVRDHGLFVSQVHSCRSQSGE